MAITLGHRGAVLVPHQLGQYSVCSALLKASCWRPRAPLLPASSGSKRSVRVILDYANTSTASRPIEVSDHLCVSQSDALLIPTIDQLVTDQCCCCHRSCGDGVRPVFSFPPRPSASDVGVAAYGVWHLNLLVVP